MADVEQDAISELREKFGDEFPAQDRRAELAGDGTLEKLANARRADYPGSINWPYVVASLLDAEKDPGDIDDFMARMRKALVSGDGYVKIDTAPPLSATTLAVAHMLADQRQESINRGDRVAYLYTHAWNAQQGRERYALACTVTNAQAKELIAAGARFVGHEMYAPK